jgi:hypothetical protein
MQQNSSLTNQPPRHHQILMIGIFNLQLQTTQKIYLYYFFLRKQAQVNERRYMRMRERENETEKNSLEITQKENYIMRR